MTNNMITRFFNFMEIIVTQLLNLAKSDDKPLFIDPSEVTGVRVFPDRNEMSIYNARGQMLFIKADQWDMDTADAVQKITASGNTLVSFPQRYDDKEFPVYISPAAVTFATISGTSEDGTAGAIVGVRGIGRQETNAATQEEISTLLEAVRATKTLAEYKPEDVHARFYRAAGLFIDPASVTKIVDDGYQVMVSFDQTGSLDVQVPQLEMGKILKAIGYSPVVAIKPGMSAQEEMDKMERLQQEAYRLKDEGERQSRMTFANGLAALNGTLDVIPTQDRAIHMHKKDITYISFYNDDEKSRYSMNLNPQPTATNPYPDALTVYFKSASERKDAFDKLQALTPKKASAPKP